MNSPHPANCAHCVADAPGAESCPAGWTGIDCGACASRDVCPDKTAADGRVIKAKGCTNACLVPTEEELTTPPPVDGWEAGKAFSCRCGGDARTDPFCAYQLDTSFHFHVTREEDAEARSSSRAGDVARGEAPVPLGSNVASAADGTLRIHVREYAGIPDTDYRPEWKYAYAFAPVWDANFTGCTWKISECMDPLPASRDCVIYECPAGVVACPPDDVPECPGRNLMGCGAGPNSTSRYWQHPCNPLVTPQDRGITFWCALNASTAREGVSASTGERSVSDSPSDKDGGYLCYWTQPGVIPSFAVTCHVGNCLYDDIEDDAAAMCPDASFTPPEFWTGDFVTKIAMFGLALSLVCLATLYVKVENKALYSLEPHTDAFERMIAAASMPRPLDQHPPHHVRTVSMVIGTRRRRRGGRRRHARGSTLESMPEEDAAAVTEDDNDDDDDARATTISWESVNVYAARVTPSRPSGVMKRILRNVSGYAGPTQKTLSDDDDDGTERADEEKADTTPVTPVSSDADSYDDAASGLFAILGPSGAGKSTLLDFLAGRTPRGQVAHGTVRLDGEVATAREVRHASGYVQQTDVLPGTSTVWEHLMFNAALRLPPDTARSETYRVVAGWMRELGLVKVAESLIGDEFTRGLSGGEKRRVSIATELLTSPGIMFLDEPTTGLDSTNAAKVVDILSGLSRAGVTVLLSIHQPRPDIFRLLDRVLVLSGQGAVVYGGPSNRAEAHFAAMPYAAVPDRTLHIADFMLDTVLRASDEDVRRMIDDYGRSDILRDDEERVASLIRAAEERTGEAGRGVAMGSRSAGGGRRGSGDGDARKSRERYHAPFWRQMRLLCGRLLRNMYRHPFLLTVHFTAAFVVALGVGAVFWQVGSNQGGIQNRMGSLFFVLLYLTLMSLSSLPVWREDRLLFLRERANGVYGVNAYFASMLLFDLLPMRVLPPFFFGLMTYQMVGLNEGTEYCLAWFVATLIATNVCASCMCMAVGAAARSVAAANVIASLCFLAAILFGGFLLNKDQIPAYASWVNNLSFINYGYEALVANEFADNPRTFTLTSGWNSSTLPNEVPVPGEKVLSTFGFRAGRVARDLCLVCAQAAGFAALSYALLTSTGGGPWTALADYVGNRKVRQRLESRRRGSGAAAAAAAPPEEVALGEDGLPVTPARGVAGVFSFSFGGGGGGGGGGLAENEESLLLSPEFKEGEYDDDNDDDVGAGPVAITGDHRRRLSREMNDVDDMLSLIGTPEDDGFLHDIDEERTVRCGTGFASLSQLNLLQLEIDAERAERSHGGPNSPTGRGGQAAANDGGLDDRQPTACHVLTWQGITCHLAAKKGGRRILRGVSGIAGPVSRFFPPAEVETYRRSRLAPQTQHYSHLMPNLHHAHVTHASADLFAILGPSGAGKTTLIDILAGRPSVGHEVAGELRVNGRAMTSAEMRSVSGYVTQDDVLPGTSTVWEHLTFHGALRLPGNVERARLKAVIWQTMQDLGISKIAHSFIGDEFTRGLSGGEKRRVSIATELLTSPGIMFLDEPTTGLDSTNAAKVVDILSGLSRAGVTVLLSIHQPRPDIFRLLDRVLVMSSTGGVIYSGPSATAESHFASMEYVPRKPEDVNVADFMLDTVLRASDEDVARMMEDYLDSLAAHQTIDAIEALKARERDEGRGARGERRRRGRAGEDEDAGEAAVVDPAGDALLSRTERGEGGSSGNANGGIGYSRSSSRSSSASSLARASGDLDRMADIPAAGLRVKEKFRASYWRQVAMLWQRMSRNVRRHPFLILLHFVATGAAAVSIGAVFFDAGRDTGGIQNRMGSLFFVLLYLTLMSLSSLPVWREDRLLFLRERASGAYGTDAYFTSMVCFDIFILRVLPPVFFTVITYPMVGLHHSSEDPMVTIWCLVWFTVVVVLTNVAASALCMAIGIVTPSNAVANVCGLLVLLVSVLCGGFLLNRQGDTATSTNPVVGWLTSLSFVNYAYEALLINEFLGAGTFHFTPKFYDSSGKSQTGVSVDVTGREVLQFFSFGDNRETMVGDLSSLCALALAYLTLAYVLLKASVRRSGVSD